MSGNPAQSAVGTSPNPSTEGMTKVVISIRTSHTSPDRAEQQPGPPADLVAATCHDLRGPLATFQALSEALEDGMLAHMTCRTTSLVSAAW